jgi:2-polyprenyl-3-methyl-5-hydroxy-6-metoxy-1,4-benzoquinol methylase
MYEEYFDAVLAVKTSGFYKRNPARKHLDWLRRVHTMGQTTALTIWPYEAPPPDPPPPPAPQAAADPSTDWKVAQEWERSWWGLEWAPHWYDEIKKQETYFRLMGIKEPLKHCLNNNCRRGSPAGSRLTAQIDPSTFNPEGCECNCNACLDAGHRDFNEQKILDVGCGPVSILQRSLHGPSRGVDPLAVSEETLLRYRKSDVEFLNIKAEEMPVDKVFDEAWIYNCLQHTDSPDTILEKTARMAHTVRIFEWIDLGVCPGHPQNLTETLFEKHFPDTDWEKPIWNVGFLRQFGGTASDKYIAIHAIRKSEPPL